MIRELELYVELSGVKSQMVFDSINCFLRGFGEYKASHSGTCN